VNVKRIPIIYVPSHILSHSKYTPASDNEHRYFSLYEKDVNINSQLESEDLKISNL